MGEINNTVPGIFCDETQEQSLAVTADSPEYMEDLRKDKYVNERDENVEDRLKYKELRKKIYDLDHSLRIQNNLTCHLQQKNEEFGSEIDKILWAQNRARLTLASQQNFQFGINHTMDQHAAQVAYMVNKADSSDEMFKRKQVLIEKIYSMKTTLQERKKEIEQIEFHANKIKQENLITRKRNQAMLIRLGRQHQEAKFHHQQILDKLTTLRDRLKKNATNIDQEKLHN
jgi:hypothetical protein